MDLNEMSKRARLVDVAEEDEDDDDDIMIIEPSDWGPVQPNTSMMDFEEGDIADESKKTKLTNVAVKDFTGLTGSDSEKTAPKEVFVSKSTAPISHSSTTKPGTSLSKNRRICLNGSCDGISTLLTRARGTYLTYYGYEKHAVKKKICEPCRDRVDVYKQDLLRALQQGKPVVEVPTPFKKPENVVIDDVDLGDGDDVSSSDEEDTKEDQASYLIPEGMNLDEVIANILKGMDIDIQKAMCVKFLKKEIADCEEFISDAHEQTIELEDKIEKALVILNKNRPPEYNKTFLRSIDIGEDGSVRVHSEVFLPLPKPVVNFFNPSPTSSKRHHHHHKTTVKKPGTQSQDGHGQAQPNTITRETKLVLLPTPKVIPRVMPKIGDKIYAMKYSSLHFWLPGIIINTRTNIFGQLEYRVQFQTTKKGKPLIDPKTNPEDVTYSTKCLYPMHIAYNSPYPFVLPAGLRVIARFSDENRAAALGPGDFYAGIVAEPPRSTNHFRYLIFFDDGYAQYVGQNDVLLVCESSKDVWRDVHPDSQEFVRNYVFKYPETPMLRLHKGTIVTIEWNGRWFSSRILEVDDSLVKVQLEIDKRVEWIYRGSARLYPIYNKNTRSIPSRSANSGIPRRSNERADIEYPNHAVLAELKKGEPCARKTTTQMLPPKTLGNFSTSNTQNLPNIRPATAINTSCLVEYEGKLLRVKIPNDKRGPKNYDSHMCAPSCVQLFNPLSVELRKVNPLLQPLWHGWNRETGKNPRLFIFYRAPCGRRLRDYDELRTFLDTTNFNMGIEYFCFDLVVDIASVFVPEREIFFIKDLSFGKEMVPIQCINSVNHDCLDFVEYTNVRLPGKDVKINLDFLSCCDCTDNCMDKDKCSCWKLTLEGINLRTAATGAFNLEVGYQERRLHEPVRSGIYECNKQCKCKSTCSNRVVQHPLKWQLQVFKTSTKGWAVRSLYDIPTGSFVCLYVGQLMNDQAANEDGANYGDEYLADLDYIESAEATKEGYEPDVVEPERKKGKAKTKESGRQSKSGGSGKKPQKSANNKKKKHDSSDEVVPAKRSASRFNPVIIPTRKPTREYFGTDDLYIMDAKTIGNIGRYLNHSCEPNLFVQNVFVDTHDLRFPWISFFAYKHIQAGSELTWDYSYEIDSVPDKTIYCYCAAPECRGRLL